MPHCAVIWCNNQSRNMNKQNTGVSYHKFPNDPDIKDKWIFATGKFNWFPQKHDTICSDHFEAASYMEKKTRKRLYSDAIPTLKLHPMLNEMKSAKNEDIIENIAEAVPVKHEKVFFHVNTSKEKEDDTQNAADTVLVKSEKMIKNEEDIEDMNTADTASVKHEKVFVYIHTSKENENGIQNTADTVQVKLEKIDEEDSQEAVTSQSSPQVHPEEDNPLEYQPNFHDTPQIRKLKLSVMRSQETIKRQRLEVKRLREANRRLKIKVAKMEKIIKGEKTVVTD